MSYSPTSFRSLPRSLRPHCEGHRKLLLDIRCCLSVPQDLHCQGHSCSPSLLTPTSIQRCPKIRPVHQWPTQRHRGKYTKHRPTSPNFTRSVRPEMLSPAPEPAPDATPRVAPEEIDRAGTPKRSASGHLRCVSTVRRCGDHEEASEPPEASRSVRV